MSSYRQGVWEQTVEIFVNGAKCGRDHGNSHERTYGSIASANASCIARAIKGNNAVSASSTSRLIVIGN